MKNLPFFASVSAAAVLGGSEIWIAQASGRTPPDALLYGMIIAAVTLWIILMAQALWGYWPFIARNEVSTLRVRAKEQDRFARLAWARIGHLTDLTAVLTCERALDPIDRKIWALEEQLSTSISPALLFPLWHDAALEWLTIVARLIPTMPCEFAPSDQHAARRVRHSLPQGRNLSSADIKAIVAYRLEREQLVIARDKFAQYCQPILCPVSRD